METITCTQVAFVYQNPRGKAAKQLLTLKHKLEVKPFILESYMAANLLS